MMSQPTFGLAFMLLFYSIQSTSINNTYALQLLNESQSYVDAINQSGYLLFYPNLTKAYNDLNMSRNYLNNSINSSIYYANLAKSDANSEYSKISQYKQNSFYAMLIFTVASGLVLYAVMQKVKKGKMRK